MISLLVLFKFKTMKAEFGSTDIVIVFHGMPSQFALDADVECNKFSSIVWLCGIVCSYACCC